jgi:hypothetical protein
MRTLNRGHVREFNPDRKDTHWGKRKLKRDQWKTRRREPAGFDYSANQDWAGETHCGFGFTVFAPFTFFSLAAWL